MMLSALLLQGLLVVCNVLLYSSALDAVGTGTEGSRRRCGVLDKTPEESSAIEAEFLQRRAQKKKSSVKGGGAIEPQRVGGVINVYMHVITDSNGNGALSDTIINAQYDVLNAAFASSGFSFVEAGRDVTANDVWYNMVYGGEDSEYAAKRALRRGTGEDLNFYTAALADNLLGWATFPNSYGSTNAYRDGVVCADFTLPGAGTGSFSLGDTGTHEVGHWCVMVMVMVMTL
jgi:hypothetical protein